MRLLTLVVEVLIGLGMVGAIFLYAEVGPWPWMPSARWWMLVGMTALLVWASAPEFRQAWRRVSFWLWVAGFLAVHLAVWTMVLVSVSRFPIIWFVPPGIVETALLIWLLSRLGFHPSHRRTGRLTVRPKSR